MATYDLSGSNKYYTLYKSLRGDILRGKIKKGEKLPSKRALAAELGVSVTTVQLAYEHLLAEGYIRSEERRGYFAEDAGGSAPRAEGREDVFSAPPALKKYAIDFTKSSPPVEMFPFSVWSRLMRGVLSESGEHLLERPSPDGDPALKRAVADYLYRSRGIDVSPRRIVIGAGAEHMYGIIVRLLGREAVIAVENPSYAPIAREYALYGAKCTPVRVLKDGADISEIARSGAAAAHLSPAHQFPTGAVTPATNRARLVDWAAGSGGYIIEDDYDGEFRLSGKPLLSVYGLCPERTIYINTFSKSLAPSMRMCYAVLPPELYEKYMRLYGGAAGLVPLFEQRALAAMLDGGYFERHIRRLRGYYRTAREKILNAVELSGERCDIYDTGGGPHMVVKFPAAGSDGEIKKRAAEKGVKLKCLSDYLIAPADGYEGCAVINYSGVTERQLKLIEGQGGA